MDDRLNKLEILYSDQSQTIEDMSAEMFRQQKEIAQLKHDLEELREKVESGGAEVGGHERPPHY